jgi:prepilin-type N-terminal cleavage/methylation domain-containing protein/prepilin-type processing-associated H-X9-DG protein
MWGWACANFLLPAQVQPTTVDDGKLGSKDTQGATMPKKGFTLIELLVVIAIIALLMGILMPALSRARNQGRAVVCLSNLKQIGLARHMYSDAYNGYVPRAMNDVKWPLVFLPFIGEDLKKIQDYREVKVYQCPSFPTTGAGLKDVSNREQTIDYIVNAWDMDNPDLTSSQQGKEKVEPTKIHRVKQPSQRVYMADHEAGDWRPIVRNQYELDLMSKFEILDIWSVAHLPASSSETSATNLHRRVARDRHRGAGCNNLFFDGHSEWLKAEENTSRYWCGAEITAP